jgi:3',5'-cyclic AMP phosphodiesterase CpdA
MIKLLFSIIFIISSTFSFSQNGKPIRIGILSDCQYCDCQAIGERNYRLSLPKLDSCIATFNLQPLDAVFHLGDMIDHDWASYDSVLPRFKKFGAPFYPVLGNHDYMIKKEFKPLLRDRLGLEEGYYTVETGDWSLIVLNGDDLSYFAPQTKTQKNERNDLVSGLYGSLRTNGMIWNGGIGSEQLKWLNDRLTAAQNNGKKVIVLCHFPLFSKKDHNLFNNKELFALLVSYPCVKAYFSGHYHKGSYQMNQGLHLVNFKGMVNTRRNAFSVVTLTSDSILIKGYGLEPDRQLEIRQ